MSPRSDRQSHGMDPVIRNFQSCCYTWPQSLEGLGLTLPVGILYLQSCEVMAGVVALQNVGRQPSEAEPPITLSMLRCVAIIVLVHIKCRSNIKINECLNLIPISTLTVIVHPLPLVVAYYIE